MTSDSAEGVTLAFVSHSPQQEVQNIFKAKHPMDTEITKAKVTVCLFRAFPSGGPMSRLSHQSVPTLPFPLCRLLGLALHSSKKSTLILPTSWEPVSSTPEPPRSAAYCVWSRICRPRSGLPVKWLNALQVSPGRAAHREAGPSAGARGALVGAPVKLPPAQGTPGTPIAPEGCPVPSPSAPASAPASARQPCLPQLAERHPLPGAPSRCRAVPGPSRAEAAGALHVPLCGRPPVLLWPGAGPCAPAGSQGPCLGSFTRGCPTALQRGSEVPVARERAAGVTVRRFRFRCWKPV